MKNKILTILLSVLIAFVLWSYVVIVIGPEYQDTFYDVKVDLESVSKALDEGGEMLLLTKEASVTLVLSGNRVDLNKLNSGNIYVTVDPSKLTPGQTDYRPDIRYPDNVSSDAFTVEAQYPSVISLDVAVRMEKSVKVEVAYNEEMIPDGYGTLPVEMEFTEVQIVGPEDVVEQIAVAQVNLELTEANSKTGILNQEFKLTFCNEAGEPVDCTNVIVPDPEQQLITISLPICVKKVIPLKVYVTEGGGATAENSVTIDPASITVLGSEEALAELNEWYLNTQETALTLGSMEAGVYSYEIRDLPEGVTNRSGKDTAEVTVSFENLVTKEFTLGLDMIQQKNLPEGLHPDISEEQIKVTVRGAKEKMDAFTASQIIAVLDFTDAKAGQLKEWPVSVSIEGAPADVGVIGGAYTVLVELQNTPQEPEPTE